MSLFRELQRRNVVRAVLAFLVGGFLFVEALDILTETFSAPDWIMKVAIVLLLAGVIPVAVFSWFYEVTPDGVKRESQDESLHLPGSQRKLDVVIVVMLGVAIGVLLYDRQQTPAVMPAQNTLPQQSKNLQDSVQKLPPMVAVLPFVASSLDGDSDFFAAGMHDDLLTQLAQMQSLRVISRTSVMEYRDTTDNIRDIGAALGADAVLEGRVQSAAGKIRINAQLIDAKTDEHLWARTYDRNLTVDDIFGLQSDMAREIANALNAALTQQDTTQLAIIPTDNIAAYRAYHRAIEIHQQADGSQADYRAELEEAIRLDPSYTRALAELAGAYAFQNWGSESPEQVQKAEEIISRIARLSPQSAEHLIAQSYYTYYVVKDFNKAHELILQAQSKAPSDIRLLQVKSWIQRRQRNIEGKLETTRQIRTFDPRNPEWTRTIAFDLYTLHRYDEAMREIRQNELVSFEIQRFKLRIELAHARRFGDWADELEKLHLIYGRVEGIDLWEAHIANRDFSEAQRIIDHSDEAWHPRASIAVAGKRWARLLSPWFSGDTSKIEALVAETRTEEETGLHNILDTALLAALAGDNGEAIAHVQRWRTTVEDDFAELTYDWDESCRILGIAGAIAETVDCLQEGLANPSTVAAPLEPYLPYYDRIRESAAFIALLKSVE